MTNPPNYDWHSRDAKIVRWLLFIPCVCLLAFLWLPDARSDRRGPPHPRWDAQLIGVYLALTVLATVLIPVSRKNRIRAFIVLCIGTLLSLFVLPDYL